MPSKKNARKQRENKTAAQDRPAFIASLKQFKEDGTGSVIEPMLVSQFPLFHGKAPPGHPYPQAFTEGATDETYCYVEMVEEDLVLLRRRWPREDRRLVKDLKHPRQRRHVCSATPRSHVSHARTPVSP